MSFRKCPRKYGYAVQKVAQPAPRARSARPPARSAGDTVARRIAAGRRWTCALCKEGKPRAASGADGAKLYYPLTARQHGILADRPLCLRVHGFVRICVCRLGQQIGATRYGMLADLKRAAAAVRCGRRKRARLRQGLHRRLLRCHPLLVAHERYCLPDLGGGFLISRSVGARPPRQRARGPC